MLGLPWFSKHSSQHSNNSGQIHPRETSSTNVRSNSVGNPPPKSKPRALTECIQTENEARRTPQHKRDSTRAVANPTQSPKPTVRVGFIISFSRTCTLARRGYRSQNNTRDPTTALAKDNGLAVPGGRAPSRRQPCRFLGRDLRRRCSPRLETSSTPRCAQ